MAEQKLIVGYDVPLVALLPNKFKCPLCELLIRDAVQTYRGELACESCYRAARRVNADICPIDKEPIGADEGEHFFKDAHARRAIAQLDCLCFYRNNGCEWRGVVNKIEEHATQCLYKLVSCQSCHDEILRKDVEQHEREECRFRMLQCTFCDRSFNAQSIQDHEASCDVKPMDCPYNCGRSIAQKEIFNHVQICEQVSAGVICPFQIVGCDKKPRDAAELQDHIQNEAQLHAALSATLVLSLQRSNEHMKKELLSEQAIRTELAMRIEEQSNENLTLETEVTKIHSHLSDVQGEITALHEKCDSCVTQVRDDVQSIELLSQQNSLTDIERQLSDIATKYRQVEEQLRTRGGAVAGASAEEHKETEKKIDRLEKGSAILSSNLSDLELKLQLLENTTYEGMQLWKIDNVQFRKTQAITGKVTALHSAPSYQKRGGYKFCSRLYLNGDGMGRGTHISLFFVVMKSEYDNLLSWPFQEKVTFRLIHPTDPTQSVEENFQPDQNSSSFKQPTKEMNIAAGCPLFVPQDQLEKFIMDDCIYIETSIGGGILPR